MCGQKLSIEEVLFEIEQDRAYYENSSGGVTLSGGEVFCQAEFAEAIVDACIARSIPTAVETNLCHTFSKMEKTLKKVTQIFVDMKIMDREEHRKWTGVESTLIVENLKKLDGLGKPFTIRTPLVPETTDTEANLFAIRDLISRMSHVEGWELMNFNPLGAGKYESLSLKNQFREARPLSNETLSNLINKLKGQKVPVRIA